MKAEGENALRETIRWDGGVGWVAYPEETIQRTSTALAVGDDVWVIDPVDAPELDELLAEFGDVAGVVVGLDRHFRDADEIASRHDVSVHVPEWMTGIQEKVSVPVERFGNALADTDVRAIKVRDSDLPPWQEVAFYRESDDTLVVPEAVGAAGFFVVGDERLGVHPMLRPFPPRNALGRLSPARVLTGHGGGVEAGAAEALAEALAGSRRRAPQLYLNVLKMFL